MNSANPATGVSITVSPADTNGASSGSSSFSRTYNTGASVTLTAPATAGGNNFSSWSGCSSANGATCTVSMNGNASVTANYTATVPTTYTLTVNSANPATGVSITVSPADNNSAANGSTSFTRVYNSGTSVTLTAPATAGGNNFGSWSGCTSTSSVTCTVVLSANTAVTATYITPTPTYTLTVNSTSPASGVAIGVSPADNNSATNGTTSFARVYNSGTSVTLTAPATSGGNNFSSWSGGCTSATTTCTVPMTANTIVSANYTSSSTYVLNVHSVNPSTGVAIGVSPADNNSVTNGTTQFTLTYNSGASVVLTAPAMVGRNSFPSWSGCNTTNPATYTCNVTLNADQKTVAVTYTVAPKITPTVAVTPSTFSVSALQPLTATVAVNSGPGNPTPTGTVQLTSGSYTSAVTNLTSGSAQINIPAGSLAAGSDILTAAYTPDTASSTTYTTASGTSSAVTVLTAVTVDQASSLGVATDQILGMNLAMWYDVSSTANAPNITTAFGKAGIKAVRWPGGSQSDAYNWETNTVCGGYAAPSNTFTNFVNNVVIPGGLDLALTADYGTGKNCTGGGDPTEAADWATAAKILGTPVTHMTVGNENYGSWEIDNHTLKHDAATYANSVIGNSGFYKLIKAASPSTLVGVVVDADNTTGGWDNTVLANAKGSYDFVEFHKYVFNPPNENDTTLVQSGAQSLTADLQTVKSEMAKWGNTVPIFVGEIGSVSSNPGKQSWSITQGLFAGQALGEVMNQGVSRLNWWIGFGNCNGDNGNSSSSLYGWQNFGAYNVFADGAGDRGGADNSLCNYGGPIGTMSPTARAFQLFSNVAVTGEHVQTATVAGDTANVRAYAATHGGGEALVLFNLNATTSEPVLVTLSGQTNSSDVKVITYDKALYDQTNSATPVWADPTTNPLGAQNLPLTLTLSPWSMNVVMIH